MHARPAGGQPIALMWCVQKPVDTNDAGRAKLRSTCHVTSSSRQSKQRHLAVVVLALLPFPSRTIFQLTCRNSSRGKFARGLKTCIGCFAVTVVVVVGGATENILLQRSLTKILTDSHNRRIKRMKNSTKLDIGFLLLRTRECNCNSSCFYTILLCGRMTIRDFIKASHSFRRQHVLYMLCAMLSIRIGQFVFNSQEYERDWWYYYGLLGVPYARGHCALWVLRRFLFYNSGISSETTHTATKVNSC